jgi:hypothetical protein
MNPMMTVKSTNGPQPAKGDTAGRLYVRGPQGNTTIVGTGSVIDAGVIAFDANDVVMLSSLTLASVVEENGLGGYLTSFQMASNEAITARIRLWFFATSSGEPDSSPVQGSAFSLSFDDITGFYRLMGYVDIAAMAQVGSGAYYAENITTRLPFKCNAASKDLKVVVQTLDAFNSVAGQELALTVGVEPG